MNTFNEYEIMWVISLIGLEKLGTVLLAARCRCVSASESKHNAYFALFPPHCSLRFSLRTRWTTKSDQRTVFTDSLCLFVCGLASPHCTAALIQFTRTPGGTGGPSWVQKRQSLVLKLLKKPLSQQHPDWTEGGFWQMKVYFNVYPYSFFTDPFSSHIFPDIGAMQLCSGEPGPPTSSAGCGCETHLGAAQHPASTKWYSCSGFCI